ncbi:hypothetical protein [Halanaerobium salsuginis]|uniref:Uncharacterized protein n=1 Tax=Halanaerobium salsuginis TaxID=29563 RepID=A0A1I4MV81_9FIRM|nr:hypothetical protein [Halanaerobium salsuginis]SFM07191.1 hypothetical protein SAMN02983006_02723 [Halanaerobium salsuginis]
MASLIFDKDLNLFARKYFIKEDSRSVNSQNMIFEHNRIIRKIGEMLLRHKGIAFKVYGKNIPLAILTNMFGISGVEKLLEQEAIKFILWTPMITYNSSDINGILPLQIGNVSSEPHSDPEKSAVLGLKFMKRLPKRRDRRRLVRKVIKAYEVPSPNAAKEAVKFGHEGYKSNIFKNMGLSRKKNITDLNKKERAKLCSLATQCLELSILSEFKFHTLDSINLMNLTRVEFNRLQKAKVIEKMENKLFEIEKLPNFSKLIKEEVIDIKEIPELRAKKDAIKFRSWISNIADKSNMEDITKEYLDSITESKGFFETNKGKFIKTVGVTSISSGIGSLIGGGYGVVLGGFIGKSTLEPLVDLGLNLLDTYILSGITKGWHPRHYFDRQIRQVLNEKNKSDFA